MGFERVFVVFVAVFVADCGIMTAKVFPAKAALVIANPKSKLLDQLKEVLRVKHYSLRTEEAYVQWVRRYLVFCRNHRGSPATGRTLQGDSGFIPVDVYKRQIECHRNNRTHGKTEIYANCGEKNQQPKANPQNALLAF